MFNLSSFKGAAKSSNKSGENRLDKFLKYLWNGNVITSQEDLLLLFWDECEMNVGGFFPLNTGHTTTRAHSHKNHPSVYLHFSNLVSHPNWCEPKCKNDRVDPREACTLCNSVHYANVNVEMCGEHTANPSLIAYDNKRSIKLSKRIYQLV